MPQKLYECGSKQENPRANCINVSGLLNRVWHHSLLFTMA